MTACPEDVLRWLAATTRKLDRLFQKLVPPPVPIHLDRLIIKEPSFAFNPLAPAFPLLRPLPPCPGLLPVLTKTRTPWTTPLNNLDRLLQKNQHMTTMPMMKTAFYVASALGFCCPPWLPGYVPYLYVTLKYQPPLLLLDRISSSNISSKTPVMLSTAMTSSSASTTMISSASWTWWPRTPTFGTRGTL